MCQGALQRAGGWTDPTEDKATGRNWGGRGFFFLVQVLILTIGGLDYFINCDSIAFPWEQAYSLATIQ